MPTMDVSTVSGVICGDAGAPLNDFFDELATSTAAREYQEWVKQRLRKDPNFYMVFQWMALFGGAVGVTEAECTFDVLEAAFALPTVNATLAHLHVKLLKCLGRPLEEATWHRVVGRLIVHDDPDVRFPYRSVVKLSERLLQCRVSHQAAAAKAAGARFARATELSVAATAGVIVSDDEGEDDEVVEVPADGGDEEEEEEAFFDYFLQPLEVRTMLMRRLCEEVLTCRNKCNKRLMEFLRSEPEEPVEEEGGAAPAKPAGKGGRKASSAAAAAAGASQHITVDEMRAAQQPAVSRPLYRPDDFLGPARSRPPRVDDQEIVRRLGGVELAPGTPVTIALPRDVASGPPHAPVARAAAPTPRDATSVAASLPAAADDDEVMEITDSPPTAAAAAPGPAAASAASAAQSDDAAGESAVESEPPLLPPPPQDDRCISFHLFQDATGEARLVQACVMLPLDSVPRSASTRSLIVTRAASAIAVKAAEKEASDRRRREREAAAAAREVASAAERSERLAAAAAAAATSSGGSSSLASLVPHKPPSSTASTGSKPSAPSTAAPSSASVSAAKKAVPGGVATGTGAAAAAASAPAIPSSSKADKKSALDGVNKKPDDGGKKQMTLFSFGAKPITTSSAPVGVPRKVTTPLSAPLPSIPRKVAPAVAPTSSTSASTATSLGGEVGGRTDAEAPANPTAAAVAVTAAAPSAAPSATAAPPPRSGADVEMIDLSVDSVGLAAAAASAPSPRATAAPASPTRAPVARPADKPSPSKQLSLSLGGPGGRPSIDAVVMPQAAAATGAPSRPAAAAAVGGGGGGGGGRDLVFVPAPAIPSTLASISSSTGPGPFCTLAVGIEELQGVVAELGYSTDPWTRAVASVLYHEVLPGVVDAQKVGRGRRMFGCVCTVEAWCLIHAVTVIFFYSSRLPHTCTSFCRPPGGGPLRSPGMGRGRRTVSLRWGMRRARAGRRVRGPTPRSRMRVMTGAVMRRTIRGERATGSTCRLVHVT